MTKARFFTLLVPLVLRAGPAASHSRSDGDAVSIIRPDANGIFDVAAAIAADEEDAIPNPFRNRSRLKALPLELTLAVTSVVVGTTADETCAIINGRAYARGDGVQGWRITAISSDSIEIRQGRYCVNLPVGNPPPRLRIRPQPAGGR